MPELWKLKYEKVADLTGEEAEAIADQAQFVEDCAEMLLNEVEDLRGKVRPEVFEALKEIEGDTFTIA